MELNVLDIPLLKEVEDYYCRYSTFLKSGISEVEYLINFRLLDVRCCLNFVFVYDTIDNYFYL